MRIRMSGQLIGALLLAPMSLFVNAGSEDVGSEGDASILPNWHGRWVGRLTNFPLKEGAPNILVTRDILIGEDPGDGCLTWKTAFSEGGDVKQIKDYRFCRKSDGSYVLDEGGGLVLESTVINDVIVSVFTARDTLLLSRSSVDGDRMIDEIIRALPKTNTPIDTDEKVIPYHVRGMQRVEFSRSSADL